eukprot:TRINITY_DN13757_c0_g1_i1.p2 TRINITY_DN13757_c0_g1~~TRINITY_DN13757_c0_g1_i1.p2  ORF type:complete len:111 (-),score=18.70 TRINITY_DN13757_c0_g1_i1:571-903(-)
MRVKATVTIFHHQTSNLNRRARCSRLRCSEFICKSLENKDSKYDRRCACKENPWNPTNVFGNQGPQQYGGPEDQENKGDDLEHLGNLRKSFLKCQSKGSQVEDNHEDDEK